MGLAGSGRAWGRLIGHLTDDHRTIWFDHRGTGDSDRVDRLMTVPALMRDALAVLDAAGVESAHVIGTSMGGMVAQELALRERPRVRSLVLLSTTPGGPRRRGLPLAMLGGAALRPLVGAGRSFELSAAGLYSRRSRIELADRIAADAALRDGDATPALTALSQLAGVMRWSARSRLPELAGLRVRIIHGEEDRVMPIGHAHELRRIIPGAELFTIPACGHLLTTEAEHEVARLVRAHLVASA